MYGLPPNFSLLYIYILKMHCDCELGMSLKFNGTAHQTNIIGLEGEEGRGGEVKTHVCFRSHFE